MLTNFSFLAGAKLTTLSPFSFAVDGRNVLLVCKSPFPRVIEEHLNQLEPPSSQHRSIKWLKKRFNGLISFRVPFGEVALTPGRRMKVMRRPWADGDGWAGKHVSTFTLALGSSPSWAAAAFCCRRPTTLVTRNIWSVCVLYYCRHFPAKYLWNVSTVCQSGVYHVTNTVIDASLRDPRTSKS